MAIADTVRFARANECPGIAYPTKTTPYHLMKKLLRTTSFTALLTYLTVTSHAAVIFVADDFNSYTPGAATFPTNVQFGTVAVVPNGGGNAVQVTGTVSTGGFYAPGFEWNPIVQPGPAGPNTTINLADYTISFDLTIDSAYIPANGFELWIAYGTMDFTADGGTPDDGANLYPISVAGFTTGVPQTVTVAMDAFHFTPFQYGDAFDPTVDQWHIQLNGVDFGSTAGSTLSFTTDNFQVAVIPEPSTYVLLLGGMCGLVGLRRRKS